MKIYKLTIVLAGLLLVVPLAGLKAADYLPKDPKDSGNVVIGSEEYRNLYVGGGSVISSKPILGDLYAGAGSVNVAGPVEKDLLAIGGNVNVSGAVGEDARLGGGDVNITGPIGGDLLVGGGTISIAESAPIGGDLWAGGGIINLNGNVSGGGKLAGGEIFVNSTVKGDLAIWAEEKLTFGPRSNVTGKIVYQGPREAVVQDGAQISEIQFNRTEKKQTVNSGAWMAGLSMLYFVKTLALLVAALVLIKLFRSKCATVVSYCQNDFWASLGIGAASLVAIPIVSIFLLVTVIGFYLGILLAVLFGLAFMLGSIVVVLFLGHLVQRLIWKKTEIELTWITVLLGSLAGAILTLIPLIGWLALFILCVVALGATLRWFWQGAEV